MNFIYPSFLWALFVLLIPLIIHFFHFKRYKTVYFSQVGFLKAVQQDTKKKTDLKKLLILISRLFMLASLVLAFSQPYIPVGQPLNKQKSEFVAIYLDNSFSMMNQSTNGPLFEEAKSKVIDIANSYGPGTNFMLVTNDVLPEDYFKISKEELINRLTRVKESPKSLSFSEACRVLENGLNSVDDNSAKNYYLLSDFQSHMSDFDKIKPDSLARIFLIHFSSPITNNLLIDSCWFETPARRYGEQENLFVKVINQSDQFVQNQSLRLFINDSLKAINNLTMNEGEEQIIEMSYRNNGIGFKEGRVELDDFPVIYDNSFYFSYESHKHINCLLIHGVEKDGLENFEALFANDPFIKFEMIDFRRFQMNQLAGVDFVILHNIAELGSGLSKTLVEFIENGGTLCLFPGQNISIDHYNNFYQKLNVNRVVARDTSALRMSELNVDHFVFKNVFERLDNETQLPEIKLSYRYTNFSSSNQQDLVRFINGASAITESAYGKGRFYNFSFPVSESNKLFMKDALFIPLVYNIALNSLESQSIFTEIKNLMYVEMQREQTDSPPFYISGIGSSDKFRVPVLNESLNHARLDFSQLIENAGFYELISDGETLKKLAFNYNRDESKINMLSPEKIQDELDKVNLKNVEVIENSTANFEEKIRAINEGVELWFFFVMLALSFLFIETIIIRWIK